MIESSLDELGIIRCPQWDRCFHLECNKLRGCSNAAFWAAFWKGKLPENTCPIVHICPKEECREAKICQNPRYWSHYQKKKNRKDGAANVESGVQKSRKTVIQKLQRKAYEKQQRALARQEIVSNNVLCIKLGKICDKHAACSILNECIVNIRRFQDKPLLLEALRGPASLKDIIQVLAEHDPTPMKSWYLKGKMKA